jgi:hypothetical protein
MLAPFSGYKTYLVASLSIVGALIGALDGDMTWSAASAVIVPALIGAAVRHGLSTSLAALLPGILEAVAKAADSAGKKAGAILLALALAGSLPSCAGLGLTGNPIADAPAIEHNLVTVCRDLGPLAAPLAAAPDAGVKAAGVVAIYAASVCNGSGNVVPAIVAGLAPETGAWAAVLLDELQAAQ